jgi:CBS domain-containing protein
MAKSIRDVMTRDPVTIDANAPVVDAARQMKTRDIGDVVVLDGGRVAGVVTDRDIVVRAVADAKDPQTTRIADVCSRDLVTVPSSASIEDAVRLMREHAVRRLPVVDDGRPVGIVSIGDLAIERDSGSALADISAAPGNA